MVFMAQAIPLSGLVSANAWCLSAFENEVKPECLSYALPAALHRIFAFNVGKA
jgi:hypothetical protein